MASKTPHTEETVVLRDLSEYPGNPRRHSARQLAELSRSLEMFGQYRPLVLNKKKQILAGNGMYQAMLDLDWEEARALTLDLTPAEEKKLLLADNQIAVMGFTDYDAVDDILRVIGDYEVPGYDPETLKELMQSADEALEAALEYGVIEDEEVERIKARNETYNVPVTPQAAPVQPGEIGPDPVTVPPVAGAGKAVCEACGRPW